MTGKKDLGTGRLGECKSKVYGPNAAGTVHSQLSVLNSQLNLSGNTTPAPATLWQAQVELMVKHQAAEEAPIGFDESGYGSGSFHEMMTNSLLVKQI
jgi:hypothetical protein